MNLLDTLKPYLSEKDSWRNDAWKAASSMGLPTKKWDAFRYASLKGLYESSFSPLGGAGVEVEKEGEVIILPLKEAMRTYGSLLQKGFAEGFKKEKNPFALLNTALYGEGVFLYVPPGKEASIAWKYPKLEEGTFFAPKMVIYLGKGASLRGKGRLEEEGTYFYNGQVDISLEEGAHLELEEHLFHSSKSHAMHTLRGSLKRDANFKLLGFSKGARCERHDICVDLLGENSEVDLQGLGIVKGKEELHHFIHVHHAAEHCRSNQHYKTALMERARASFEGKIFVEKEAQLTEAYQLNNNLLLSPNAQAMSKPNLEIFADDVKASHGATCTQPQAEERFYLQTRGLSSEEALWHLARGFCKEILRIPEIDALLLPGGS